MSVEKILQKYVGLERIKTGDIDVVYKGYLNDQLVIIKIFNGDFDKYTAGRFLRERFIYNSLPFKHAVPELIEEYPDDKLIVLQYIVHDESPTIPNFSFLINEIPQILKTCRVFWEYNIKLCPEYFNISTSVIGNGRVLELNKHEFLDISTSLSQKNKSDFYNIISSQNGDQDSPNLIHGDLHLHNMIKESNSLKYLLIDFGRARIANINYDLGYFVYRMSCGQFMNTLSTKQTLELIDALTDAVAQFSSISPKAASEKTWKYFLYVLFFDYFWWKNNVHGSDELKAKGISEYCAGTLNELSNVAFELKRLRNSSK